MGSVSDSLDQIQSLKRRGGMDREHWSGWYLGGGQMSRFELVVWVMLFSAGFHTRAETFKSFQFENGKLNTYRGLFDLPAGGGGDPVMNGNYSESGQVCLFVNKGWADAFHPVEKRVWISSTTAAQGRNSIVYELLPTRGSSDIGGVMDKVQHALLERGQGFVRNRLYYVGFSIFVSPTMHGMEPHAPDKLLSPLLKTKSALIYQQWQGSPYPPPFAILLSGADAGSLSMDFMYRDNATFHPRFTEERNFLRRLPLERGRWMRIIVASRQCDEGSPRGCSVLRGWIVREKGGEPEQLFYHRGDWGYYGVPMPTWSLQSSAPFFQVEVGLYRERQERHHMVAFDDIRITDTFAEAR